jgi:hypothetical protein
MVAADSSEIVNVYIRLTAKELNYLIPGAGQN